MREKHDEKVLQSGRVTEQETKATSEGFNILHCTAVLTYSTVSLTISIGAIPSRLIKKKKKRIEFQQSSGSGT